MLTQVSLNSFLEEGARDRVLVVPKRDRQLKTYLNDIRRFQAEGIIEPD